MKNTIIRKQILRAVIQTWNNHVAENAKRGFSVAGSLRRIAAQVLLSYNQTAYLNLRKN